MAKISLILNNNTFRIYLNSDYHLPDYQEYTLTWPVYVSHVYVHIQNTVCDSLMMNLIIYDAKRETGSSGAEMSPAVQQIASVAQRMLNVVRMVANVQLLAWTAALMSPCWCAQRSSHIQINSVAAIKLLLFLSPHWCTCSYLFIGAQQAAHFFLNGEQEKENVNQNKSIDVFLIPNT